jgi:hypothetical protein
MMSSPSKNTSLKNQRKEKYDLSNYDEKSQRFRFVIDNWSRQKQCEVIKYDMELFGLAFKFEIYPQEMFEDSPCLGAYIRNASSISVHAKYSIHIIRQSQSQGEESYSWSDPEGVVLFCSKGEGDDCWGTLELMPLSELSDPSSNYIVNDSLVLEVDLLLYVTDEYSRSIAITLEEACVDLNQFIRKMKPSGRDLNYQKQREDSLIKTRFT